MSTVADEKKKKNFLLTFVVEAVFFIVLLTTYSIVFTSFYIPSSSMNPTLKLNDRILVNKFIDSEDTLQVGDIVVFKDPGGWVKPGTVFSEPSGAHLVKRIIGMPGDHIECCDSNGRTVLNGVPIDESYVRGENLVAFDEVVPEGYLWVEGDNRENSADSRYNKDSVGDGFVPISNVVGKTVVRFWPIPDFKIF